MPLRKRLRQSSIAAHDSHEATTRDFIKGRPRFDFDDVAAPKNAPADDGGGRGSGGGGVGGGGQHGCVGKKGWGEEGYMWMGWHKG